MAPGPQYMQQDMQGGMQPQYVQPGMVPMQPQYVQAGMVPMQPQYVQAGMVPMQPGMVMAPIPMAVRSPSAFAASFIEAPIPPYFIQYVILFKFCCYIF